ncbi:MAG: MBL fold metallo-hydrolase, partial [Bacteroidota bacterium]|nr:MBL fold metallo-hydrolase [Bacteroidota bacterium]
AFCTDTAYTEEIIPFIQNVDLIYHEATFLSTEKETALTTSHSTANQAAMIAKKANVKSLIIGHFSSRYKYITPFLTEAKNVFENTYIAYDGLKIEIDNEHNIYNVSK